jgi:UTP-glucose-1-phosphate uridylyltransferase
MKIKPTLLILAAGMGSRYGGLKQIDKIGPSGEAIIDYSIYDAIRAGFGKVVLVIRRELEEDFREFFGDKLNGKIDVEYVYQEIENVPAGISINTDRKKPWGTGHAILVAREAVKEPFAVINADDFYGAEAYTAATQYFNSNQKTSDHFMAGYRLEGTLSEHGTVSRGVCKTDANDFLLNIEEITNIEKKESRIGFENSNKQFVPLTGQEVVSMNFWGFYPEIFETFKDGFEEFIQNAKNDPKAEYYIALPLTDMLRSNRGRIKVLQTGATWFGVTYQADKTIAMKKIQTLTTNKKYPENLWG